MREKILCYTKEKRIRDFFMTAIYLDDVQNAAIDGIMPMTQEVFDSIMKRREEVGAELEEVSMEVFLKYPQFAKNYTDRLEAEIGSVDDTLNFSPLQEQLVLEQLKIRIRKEFGEEI